MNYTKIQKFISSLVLFSLLFGITFRIPFYDFSAYAENDDFFNLVSVIVDEDTYVEIKTELNRYAKDIQGVLENTKVVILPTPIGTPAFNIASLNESLFYEGYKSIDDSVNFESKLIGTVLVGDFELPVVYDKNESSKTIVPFTDFDDKAYIYNHSASRYEKNDKNLGGLKSEIWHGVISPNLGDFSKNIEGLKDYFDKNHDFYAGTGNFKFSEGILNGDKNIPVNSSYEPFVFYYDQFRESKSLNYNKYIGYKAYLDNKEDIVYNRFTKELSDKVTDLVLGQSTGDIGAMVDSLSSKIEELGDDSPFLQISEEMKESLSNSYGPDSSQTPDIQTRYLVNNLVNKFLETFSKGSMGDFRTDVDGAGRYSGTGGEVNVDLIPYIVTVLDLINDNIIKEANDELEKQIDDLVKNGLSRNIGISSSYNFYNEKLDTSTGSSYIGECYNTDINYFYGLEANNINSAEECSIYRGSTNSGQLVEANRGLNINLVQSDLSNLNSTYCKSNILNGSSLKGFWGGNSPLGMDKNSASNGDLELSNSNLKSSIVPLFDIAGSKEIFDVSKNPSPLDCFDNNLLSYERKTWNGISNGDGSDYNCSTIFKSKSTGWSCTYDNLVNKNSFNTRFEEFYKSTPENNINSLTCESDTLNVYNKTENNFIINKYFTKTDEDSNNCITDGLKDIYNFKIIPSYITHKSPTSDHLSKQINNGITPNLPIDKNRYIDFIGAKGDYLKIDYPALFRIKSSDPSNITIESIEKDLDEVLAKKSQEINNLINFNNPSALTGTDLELYNILKNGAYPSSNFDLINILKQKEDKEFEVAGEKKTLNYYDALVFAIYWNNLNSVSAKYGFVFDKYLTDQFGSDDEKYFLPKNKKQYEIAYIGANGDSSNMYIKMDPESKAENPYGDILGQNINLSSALLGSNIGQSGEEQSSSNKCSPPGGVPIWEWFPAVMCRLGEMKPEITFSDGACGESFLSDDEENNSSDFLNGEKCIGDLDDNGISDCIENNLSASDLELSIESDSDKYYYNSTAKLKTSLKDKNGNIIKSDNASKISYEIIKIEVAKDKNKELSEVNREVVFDIDNEYLKDKAITSKYVDFKELTFRNKFGQTEYSIGLKSKVSNIYLRAFIEETDFDGNKKIFIESKPLLLKIRGDRLFASSYKFVNDEGGLDISLGTNSVKVSDKANIFLSDGNINKNIDSISNSLNNNSTSTEKLVFLLDNMSSFSNSLKLEYPLEVNIYKDSEKFLETITINKNEINNFRALASIKKTGNYSIEILDRVGSKIEKKFIVMPEEAEKLDIVLGSSIMESSNNVSTNFVTIYDRFDNVVSGEYYNIDFNISGNNSLRFFDNKEKKYSTTTFEGYKIFRLESLESGVSNLGVKVSKDDKIILEQNANIRVLDEINLEIEPISDIKVGGGEYKFKIKLTGASNKKLDDFNSRIYLKSDSLFIGSKESFSEIKSGEAELSFFTKNLAGKDIEIEFQVEGLNKTKKIKIDILPESPIKLDLILSNSKIEASPNSSSTLYVELKDRYNNLVFNDNSTKTNLEILDQYKHIISSNETHKIVSGGKTSYTINGTLNPGVAYFKVGTNPSLSLNSFKIVDSNGELTVNGVGENASKIETFYFWNKEKLEGKKYNSLYTNLLGSSYGDITKLDYLAGSLLFEKENRALAVTSLLNDSSNYYKIIDLKKSGGLKSIYSTSDLSQDIDFSANFKDDKLGFDIYNKALNNYIGKVYYNFSDDNVLIGCETNINDCLDKEKTSILLKSKASNYNVSNENDRLYLKNNIGETLLEITRNGSIIRDATLSFEINKNNNYNYLSVNVIRGKDIIAELAFNFVGSNISLSRDDISFNAKINNLKNSILVLTKTNNYGIQDDSGNKIFYYIDPFASDNPLDNFSKDNLFSFENFPKKQSIGWEESNKSLLSFAAGKSVGESTKDYMSFGLINLGDPVISLKKIKEKLPKTDVNRQFDSTIGKLLSTDDDILSYDIFDYNNDNREDILLIKNDGYLKLLENKKLEGIFIDKGNLAHIVDLGNKELVKTGDFSGDGFDDIFFVNNKGKAFILNNKNKDFVRYSLEKDFSLAGNILQAEVFDMDNDYIDDIVIFDDSGEINIFYGTSYLNEPKFSKLKVSDGHGIKINSEISSHNSLLYFDGLIDLFEDKLDNKDINLVLVDYPYDFNKDDKSIENISKNNQIQNTKFIKSEYADYTGLKVEKKFEDVNGGFLKKDDIIDVEITLTNTSTKDLKNIIFAEKLPELLRLDKNSIELDIEDDFSVSSGELGYNFSIDNLELKKDHYLTINYKAKVLAFKYGHLDVGLFEKGEVGDDDFGDIIFKQDNKNCSENLDIFRSASSRSYLKGIKELSCDEDKIKLPDEIEKNTIDEDGNGIPDYIDKLTGNTSEIQNYAKEQLNNLYLDNDGDGIPNSEDFLDGKILESLFNNSSNSDNNLDANITIGGLSGVESSLDNIQELFNSLNCGNAGCFASPLNWAPLAPGSDPVFNGKLIGDGLNIDEGYPILSALTGMEIYVPACIPIPVIWPISSYSYETTCSANLDGAGGSLGVESPLNFFRLFVSPTITGGVGTAVCFGGPAIAAGNIMPEGLSPLVPGGNCIVVAKKMNFCSNDGSDGDVASIGNPYYSSNGSFSLINGNCTTSNKSQEEIYYENIKNSDYNSNMDKTVSSIFDFLPGNFSANPINKPFIEGGENMTSIKLDLGNIDSGNFDDIIKIQKTRISAFPGFLMDWVTRQIEEIVNKLTDFPTLFIILPDFSGIFDGDWDINSGNAEKLENGSFSIDDNLSGVLGEGNVGKINSGIKEAYEFIGSIPLVKIEQKTVDITLPWISEVEINKTIATRTGTIKQWEDEIQRAKEAWSFGAACEYEDPIKQEKCEEQNSLSSKASIDVVLNLELVLQKLRQNLEIIKEYKEIPERINELINTKQKYLEQILCNIETISTILGGRIGKNGDIFKTWVELYILIKAILKSWQMLIDVFIDFEMECNECKNERQDALETEFSLIDMIVPQIPVIQFPKWPDIILDLHNIRAGLNIGLPEFNIDTKPIILPQLPKLFLPDVPSVNLALEIDLAGILDIPLLPRLEIPELPDIPSLPTVHLPDLPPPPKLPKMLASIEVVLDIIKLITKAMCILKSSPIHPEWRAGDQIAFLTERSGYLGSDFINISLPQFSFPFLDAIKVTTYVNLEFETDFIVELARQIAMPINNFTNDFTNIFDLKIPNLDLRGVVPQSIDLNIKVGEDGVESDDSVSYKEKLLVLFADRIGLNMKKFSETLDEGKNDLVSNLEFQKLINNSLSSKSISSNPKLDNLRKLWSDVNNMTYSKENELIEELKNNNSRKFETLKDIINTEIIKNKSLKEKIELIGNDSYLNKVSDNSSNIDLYNERLDVYNKKFIDSAKKLYSPDLSTSQELKELGNDVITPLKRYNDSSLSSEKTYTNNNLYANNTSVLNSNNVSQNSCQAQAGSDTRYDYKGLYVIENDISYRLFNYLDELDGNEKIRLIDFDKDLDEDILYIVKGQLFLKENLEKNPTKSFVSDNPITLKSQNNKFFNEEEFIEAINNLREVGVDSSNINIGFRSPSDKTISNFKIGFYNRVDKYINEENSNYRPEFIKKDMIDAFVDIENSTKVGESEFFINRKNLAYIKNIGNFKGLELNTARLNNIKNDLLNSSVVNIVKGTKIYTKDNSSTIKYVLNDSDIEQSLTIAKNSNIEFKNDIKIIAISGDLFVKGVEEIVLDSELIQNYKGYPLFPDSKIRYIGNNYETTSNSYIDIEYYDSSEYGLDFNYINSYEIYDLGLARSDYNLRLNRENDYYYLKMQSFKNNIFGTLSNQVLISPQIEADKNAPISSLADIRIPVYQKQEIDITDYIYEDSGINNIKNVFIDFDLENDTDGNGNKKDDNDSKIDGKYKDKLKVKYGLSYIKLELGAFEHLFRKKVGVTIIDKNDNVSYQEISFEVYSPKPEISEYIDGKIMGVIDENLTNEPIDLYRYRGGVITKLIDKDGNKKINTSSGTYIFDIGDTNNKGLVLTNNGSELLNINEKTGKIYFNDITLQTKVLSSSNNLNNSPFVKIIVSKNNTDIYYQYLQFDPVKKVEFVSEFGDLKDRGIYFKFDDLSSYNYFTTPENIDYNPGSLSIYRNSDLNKTPLFTIFNDGRINTANEMYKLEYTNFGDYVSFKLIDSHFNREVGQVLFLNDSEYIIK